MNVLHTTLQNALEQIQGVHPLLHCISNIVTANDCANLALAIGASPIMAQEPQEMPQIATLAKAVILNTGTPDEAKFQAAAIAGKTANQLHIPVILDPVGIGASTWRLNHIHDLLSQVHPDILRVNLGEAKALLCYPFCAEPLRPLRPPSSKPLQNLPLHSRITTLPPVSQPISGNSALKLPLKPLPLQEASVSAFLTQLINFLFLTKRGFDQYCLCFNNVQC